MKTQRIKALLALLLLIVTPTVALAADPVAGVVMAEAAFVYSGVEGQPGRAYPFGSPIEVLQIEHKVSHDWVRVKVNGEIGFMRREELTTVKKFERAGFYVLGSAVPLGTDSPAYLNAVANGKVLTQELGNIPGSTVTPNYQMTLPDGTVTPANATVANHCTAPATATSGFLYVKSDILNLRQNNSTNSTSLAKFPKDTVVNALCNQPPWTQVKVGDQIGWMHNDHLTGTTPAHMNSLLPPETLPAAPTDVNSIGAPPALGYAPQTATTPAVAATQTLVPPANVGANHCISSGIPKSEADRVLIEELKREFGVSSLNNILSTDYETGTEFRINLVNDSIIVTVTNLNEQARNKLAVDAVGGLFAGLARGKVDEAIANGQISFEVNELCRENGLYAVTLEGINSAKDNLGRLRLAPGNGGMIISGHIGSPKKDPLIIREAQYRTSVAP